MAKLKVVDGGLLKSRGHEVFIGIDQSLTGFAVTAYAPLSGEFYSWVYTSPYKGVKRLVDIQRFLNECVQDVEARAHTVVDYGMEASVFQSQSASVLGELAAAVKLKLFENCDRFPLRVPVTMVKKYATNKGTAKKNEVMLGIYKNWDVEFADDNMADSYVIARIVSSVNGSLSKELVYQKEVITAIQATPEKFRDS